MAKDKNKNNIPRISVYLTVMISMTVFLIFALPLIAQEINANTNPNLNDHTNSQTNVNAADNSNTNVNSAVTPEENVGDLTGAIGEKRKRIDELNQQSKIYEENIKEKQHEKASLNKDIYLLDNQINLTNLEISRKQTEIESLELEIQETQKEIDQKKNEIDQQKTQLAEFIRIIYHNSQTSYLEIALLNDSFSDFFNHVKYLNEIEGQIKKDLDKYEVLKHDLEIQQEDLSGKKAELDDSRQVLVEKKGDLGDQADYQKILLEQTENSESEYSSLLDELKKEALAVQGEISSLEKRMREKLLAEKGEQYYGEFSGTFIWPADSKTISCGFHCDGYPYEKWLGPHSGMDVSISQGSSVYAAADGYVAIARKLDWTYDAKGRKRSAYNYISIIHNNELSTIYGHLSQINVAEGDFVTKGQVIGATGGLPGTAGAGAFSTGAHLHFEVRKVNESGIPIPVDPAAYLP